MRRADDDDFPYPQGLTADRIIIDQTCTQDPTKKAAVADALKWIPTLIERGQKESKVLKETYENDNTAAKNNLDWSKWSPKQKQEESRKGLVNRMES